MVLNGAVEHVGNTKVDLSGYVQKETGKGLSTNDFDNDAKTKLDGIDMASRTPLVRLSNYNIKLAVWRRKIFFLTFAASPV